MIGCEISVTTDTEHELANLRKRVEFGFTRLLFISRMSAEGMISPGIPEIAKATPVDVLSPDEIVFALVRAGP